MIKLKRFKLDKGRTTLIILRLFKAELHLIITGSMFSIGNHSIRLPYWLMPNYYASLWADKWRFSPFPIYWDRYSRDCDQFAVAWCERHPNGWTAYSSMCDALDSAEGPEHFSRITKVAYELHKDERSTRDHAAEQMNY